MKRKEISARIKPQKNSSNKAAWTAVIAALAAAVIAVVSVPTYLLQSAPDNAAQASGNRQLPIYSVATEEKKIAISFDCAWGECPRVCLLWAECPKVCFRPAAKESIAN